MAEYAESSYYFFKLILKWKKHFIVLTLASLVLSILFSSEWFIKPKYKSFAIVYPSNIIPYSSESPSEQMLQLFESADIRNALIHKFNLAARYNIDTNVVGGYSKLIAVYLSNVEVNRTQYESIEIKVLDTDPKVACEMVNAIITAINIKARELQREKSREVLVMEGNQLKLKKHQVDSLNIVLVELRVKYQILDYDSQTKEVTKAYLKALTMGKSNIKDIDLMLRNLEEKGGEFVEVNKIFEEALKGYNATKTEYDNVLKGLKKELTYTNIVTKPSADNKKAYPIRWLIVLASVASTNLLLFIILLVLDVRKKIVQ